jgi:hypothetical protein
LSVKGGSQEVAAVVANMNQPDFSESFVGWLQTVHKYPRAFDFKFESIVSILDINVKNLFSYITEKEIKICNDIAKEFCHFGFTIDEFEKSWQKKLSALQFAITIYLKEPNGLRSTQFYIEKGTNECRFNILNYLSPFWSEIVNSEHEFHIAFNLNTDEPTSNQINSNISQPSVGEYYFKKSDQLYFMRREEFWLSKLKGQVYTYKSAKLLSEPFKRPSQKRNFINILGLVLEYNQRDATLSVVNISEIIEDYSNLTRCHFEIRGIQKKKPHKGSASLISENKILPYIAYKPASSSSTGHSFKRSLTRNISSPSHLFKRENRIKKCKRLHKALIINTRNVKNLNPFWIKYWHKVVGVIDYVDPIQAVMRTWDLKFAVLPCQLRWSNNLMMVLSRREQDGKCLKFTAATEGELFVVIASTPSNQQTWYTFQITIKGVVFYKVTLLFFSFYISKLIFKKKVKITLKALDLNFLEWQSHIVNRRLSCWYYGRQEHISEFFYLLKLRKEKIRRTKARRSLFTIRHSNKLRGNNSPLLELF